jgi:hypothetical protein
MGFSSIYLGVVIQYTFLFLGVLAFSALAFSRSVQFVIAISLGYFPSTTLATN